MNFSVKIPIEEASRESFLDECPKNLAIQRCVNSSHTVSRVIKALPSTTLICAGQGTNSTHIQSHQGSVPTIESFLGNHCFGYFKYMYQFKSTSKPKGVQHTKLWSTLCAIATL